MKYRKFGRAVFKVSEIGFGGWQIGGSNWGSQSDKDSIEALNVAIDRGVNFIDTAKLYGNGKSEQIIGKILKERKETIYVSTKTPPLPGPWPTSPYNRVEDRYPDNYILDDIEERKRMLGVSSLDILLLHTWNRAWNKKPAPLVLLNKLKKEGKIKYIGVSTVEYDQNGVIELIKEGLIDVVELVFNIFEQEPAAELLPIAEEFDIGVISRAPLDEGSLTGKYNKDTTFEKGDFRNNFFRGDWLNLTLERVEKLKEEIKDTGLTLAQVAIKFVLAQSSIDTVIPGMRNAWEAREDTSISDLPPLSEEFISKLRNHYWHSSLGRHDYL